MVLNLNEKYISNQTYFVEEFNFFFIKNRLKYIIYPVVYLNLIDVEGGRFKFLIFLILT